TKMSWYHGGSLLDHLEQTDPNTRNENLPARFPVQFVIRPHSDDHHDFRGYAGQLLSGTISKGEKIVVLPSLKSTSVKKILRAKDEVTVARAGESITIELEEDIDISRGNMIVPEKTGFTQVNAFVSTLAWMDEQLLVPGKTYWLQHGVNLVKAKINQIQSKIDMQSMEPAVDLSGFGLNDIGKVSIRTAKPIFADLYRNNPHNGSFILIDEFSNNTVAVGFIESI
ncbi:MAG: elongation factor 1-alpha C-terminal domain-related protein, partial [Flavisolibacter sp.]